MKKKEKKNTLTSNETHGVIIDVTKLSKKWKLRRYIKCLQIGHNKITCKKNSHCQNSITPSQLSRSNK